MRKALEKFSRHISREQLVAAGGTPSVGAGAYKKMSPAQQLKYNQQNSKAVAGIIGSRKKQF